MQQARQKYALLRVFDKKRHEIAELRGTRMRFRCTSSMSQTPNTMVASVYGISEEESGRVAAKGYSVRLFAGSNESSGVIGEGQVVSSRLVSGQDGMFLEVTSVDGDDFYAITVNRTITAGITLSGLVTELIGMSNGSAGIGQISPRANDIALPRGVSIIGSPLPTIRGVAKQINAAFYVNHGMVYIVCPDETVGVTVNIEDDRLLNHPVRDGYFVQFMHDIEPSIRVGGTVLLPGNGGMYRVQRISVEGDTIQPTWRMIVEGAEQTADGFAQTALSSNVWR